MDVVRDLQMSGDRDGALDRAAPSDAGASADRGAGGDGGMGADVHVVADLDEVVQLHAVLDDGVLEGAAIDRRIRADLHVVSDPHPAELGDLHPDPVVVGDTESVGADDGPWMNDGPCADVHAPAHHDPGRDAPLRTDRRTPAEERPRTEGGPRPDAGAGFDHAMVPDRCIRGDPRVPFDHGAGRDARRRLGRRGQQRGGARVAQVRIVEHQRRHRAGAGELRRQDHRAGSRTREVWPVAPVGEERDGIGPRRVQGSHPIDDEVRITGQPGSDTFGELPETIAQDSASATRPISRPIP